MTARATRRGLLALASAAALVAPATDAAPHPDAELLAACARFRALTAEHAAFFTDIPDEEERDDAIDAMHDDWEAALDPMCEAPPATTLAGVVARAMALAESTPEKLVVECGYWDERQLAALLRDLVAMAEARPPA